MNKGILFTILILLIISDIHAQDKTKSGEKPRLNGHYFIPISANQDPFMNTKLTTPVGFGQTSKFNFPLPIIDNDTIEGVEGEVFFASLGLQYRQRVREWVAFYVNMNMAARIGTDVASIIFEGFNSVLTIEVGSKFRIVKTDKIMISTGIEVQNYDGRFVDIDGFIEDIINRVPDPSAVLKVPALTTGLSLNFAAGLSPTFGLGINSTVSYGETFVRGRSDFLYNFTFILDADLNPKFNIPVGIAISHSTTTEPEVVYLDDRSAQLTSFKIAYTGQKDFDFGIEAGRYTVPLEKPSSKPVVSNFIFSMTYFFN